MDIRILLRTAAVFFLTLTVLIGPASSEDAEPKTLTSEPDIRLLAEEVDVLQIAAELKLTDKQINYILGRVEALDKKREEMQKREETILLGIKDSLQQTKTALVAGKDVPAQTSTATAAKLKELQELRVQSWQEFQSAVAACVRLMDEGQVRVIARSPAAMARAQQIVQQTRAASATDWPTVLETLSSELLEVKKLDNQAEWLAELEKIRDLTGEEHKQALADIEKRKETAESGMKAEISQLLTSIRTADPRVLSVGVNRVASALRPQAEVQAQIFDMMARILDSPGAETALKARLTGMGTSAADTNKTAGN